MIQEGLLWKQQSWKTSKKPCHVFLKHKTVWSSYDSDADVLYLYFKKPGHTDNSEMTKDEVIIRYENNEIIGMAILNASRRV